LFCIKESRKDVPAAARLGYRDLGWAGAASTITSLLSSLFRRREVFSPEHVVTALYRGILEREPDSDGFRLNVKLLRSGRALERVIRSFVISPEFRSRILAGFVPVTHVATALYRGILEREPDSDGFRLNVKLLRSGQALERVIRSFVISPEFRSRILAGFVPVTPLPDLRASLPGSYETQSVGGVPMTVYLARTDADIALMASLIDRHRFYDRFGVWSPVIDHDKKISAAIVRGLGARSCFELGCFTGSVISLLANAGVSVLGAEVSHLAFAFAQPNIREAMIFGDLLTLDIDRRFDVVLCMDVLEHVSPLQLDYYVEKLLSLIEEDGYIYLNAPMWGKDHVFGVFEEPYLEEWLTVGGQSYWRHWPCDDKGWPIHGHLVWASAHWWERKFRDYGLVRDTVIEQVIHQNLATFFEQAKGRRCLFVLRRPDNRRSSAAVAAAVHSALANCH
jgi:SAM-dependent methyltransferase